MGLSLGAVSREIDEARALKAQLASAEEVVELDPASIDPSPVRDRLGLDGPPDAEMDALVESLRENGQQVPVLVRPHPEAAGRYQTAYGHRRIQAAARLGLPVRAVVRVLTDDALVLAQGKENTERRSLSFIERALFAQALIGRGFERGLVQRALSVHKAEMTRLLQVAALVPRHVANAIGPAPKAGRPRWLALAEFMRLPSAVEITQSEIMSDAFLAASSDERFRRLHARLERRARARSGARPAPKPRAIVDRGGRAVARFMAGPKPRLEFDEKEHPGLAGFVADRLPELIAEHEASLEAPERDG